MICPTSEMSHAHPARRWGFERGCHERKKDGQCALAPATCRAFSSWRVNGLPHPHIDQLSILVECPERVLTKLDADRRNADDFRLCWILYLYTPAGLMSFTSTHSMFRR